MSSIPPVTRAARFMSSLHRGRGGGGGGGGGGSLNPFTPANFPAFLGLTFITSVYVGYFGMDSILRQTEERAIEDYIRQNDELRGRIQSSTLVRYATATMQRAGTYPKSVALSSE